MGSHPGLLVNVPFSSSLLPLEPLLLLEDSPLVLSLTRSKKLSVSHVCRLSLTHALITSPSLSHHTSTFQSLLSVTLTLQPGSSTLQSHATTRESTPSVLFGGSLPEKSSGSVEPSLANRNGTSCQKAAEAEAEPAPQDWSEAAPGDWNNEPAPGMNLGETPVPVAGAPEAAAAVAEGEAPVDDWAAQSTQAQKEQTGDWGENVEGSW